MLLLCFWSWKVCWNGHQHFPLMSFSFINPKRFALITVSLIIQKLYFLCLLLMYWNRNYSWFLLFVCVIHIYKTHRKWRPPELRDAILQVLAEINSFGGQFIITDYKEIIHLDFKHLSVHNHYLAIVYPLNLSIQTKLQQKLSCKDNNTMTRGWSAAL